MSQSLGAAIKSGDESAVYNCLLGGDDPDEVCWDIGSPHPPILIAALSSNPDILRLLCEAGCDVNARNVCGESALHLVISKKSKDIYNCIDVLLDYQADCSIQEKMHGCVPLHWLAKHISTSGDNSTAAMRTLHRLSCHTICDPPPIDHRGRTPVHYAVLNSGTVPVIEMLVNACGADGQNFRGETALHECIESEASEANTAAAHFLMANTDLNIVNTFYETPLLLAAKKGKLVETKELLGLGSDVNAQDANGDTALHVAAARGFAEVVAALCGQENVDINIVNKDGLTPLHIAVESNFTPVVEVLLKFESCDINIRNNSDQTALDLAKNQSQSQSHSQISSLIEKEMNRRSSQ